MVITFTYQVRDRVINPLGDEGIVTMAGVDNGEMKTYFVTTRAGGAWWYEDQLTRKE